MQLQICSQYDASDRALDLTEEEEDDQSQHSPSA